MLQYNAKYEVFICKLHKHAVADPGWHLRVIHGMTSKESDALVEDCNRLIVHKPNRTPPDEQESRSWLASPVEGYSCTGCRFLTKRYSNLVIHWRKDHRLALSEIPAPTFEEPKSYAKCVRMQTLFPWPDIKWFTVKEGQKPSDLNKMVESMSLHHDAQRQKVQRLCASKHHEHNMQHSYLHRLPAEIRDQIYDLALAEDITYHIADMLGPVEPEYSNSLLDEHDQEFDTFDVAEDEYDFRDVIERDIDGFFQRNRSYKLRAISLSSQQRHPVGLLQTCTMTCREASSLFYSRNRFFIHTRWQNFITPIQFLESLRPETRRCIQSLCIQKLRPAAHSAPDFIEDHQVKQASLYYASMKSFLHDFVPQLSLNSLVLCLDLRDLYGVLDESLSFSPQAPWLNPFLRLPLNRIGIRILSDSSEGYVDHPNIVYTAGGMLVDQLNAIDFRTRVTAKRGFEDNNHTGIPLWWMDLAPEERIKEKDRVNRYRRVMSGGESQSFLDIWAEHATKASAHVLDEAKHPYE